MATVLSLAMKISANTAGISKGAKDTLQKLAAKVLDAFVLVHHPIVLVTVSLADSHHANENTAAPLRNLNLKEAHVIGCENLIFRECHV